MGIWDQKPAEECDPVKDIHDMFTHLRREHRESGLPMSSHLDRVSAGMEADLVSKLSHDEN